MDRKQLDTISNRLLAAGWFARTGVHAIVDGQFGSTGKGVAASILAHTVGKSRYSHDFIGMSSAGPNSGHTAIYKGHKMVTQQLPISAVQSAFAYGWGKAYLNAGAVIRLEKLDEELAKYNMDNRTYVHPNAAVITDFDIGEEIDGGPAKIASTGKGVGAAIAKKVMREGKVYGQYDTWRVKDFQMEMECSIMEVAQGFSLGVNQQFYPYCTSRECTVGQAMSDANMHPSWLRKTMMAVRTYPIRVGNTDKGNSGGWYPDQREMTWEELGKEPEMTTVTKRIRRVATWSRLQFRAAVRANRPDAIFLNFCNYLDDGHLMAFINDLEGDYRFEMGCTLPILICGWGPETEETTLWT